MKWSEKTGPVEEKTEVEHTVEEIYFNETVMLWGQGMSSRDLCMLNNPLCKYVGIQKSVTVDKMCHTGIYYYLLLGLL